ncbi:MAG: CDP-alcohol phosphatidyltransferase family protein [Thermoanaerobaculia bacterium]
MTLTIPNVLTLLRMGLVPLFIIAVLDGHAERALLIFLVAGLTDALDGFIARFWNQRSLLGAYLDPIADKLLLVSAWVVLSIPSLAKAVTIPLWVTVLVIARDVLIVIVGLIFYLAMDVKRFPISLLSKATTALQVTTLALVLSSGLWARLVPVAEALVYVVAVFTLLSGLDYLRRYSRSDEMKARPG